MRAALHAVRRQGPARLILAVPVAAAEGLAGLQAEANSVVCLQIPKDFVAVGAHYAELGGSDEDVVRLLSTTPPPAPT